MRKTTAFFHIAMTLSMMSAFFASAVYPSDIPSCLRLELSSNDKTFQKRFKTLASAQSLQAVSPEDVVVIPSVMQGQEKPLCRKNMPPLLREINSPGKIIVIVCFDDKEKKNLENMFLAETKKWLEDFKNVYIKVYGKGAFAYKRKHQLEHQFEGVLSDNRVTIHSNGLGAFTLSALRGNGYDALYKALAKGLPLASNDMAVGLPDARASNYSASDALIAFATVRQKTPVFSAEDFKAIYKSMRERVMSYCGYEDHPEEFVTYVNSLALFNVFEYEALSDALTKRDFWETLLQQEGLSAVKDALMLLAAHNETLTRVPEGLRPFAAQVMQTLRQYYFTPRILLNDRQGNTENKENKTLIIRGADVRTKEIAGRLMSAKDKRLIVIARNDAEKNHLKALFAFKGESTREKKATITIVSGAVFSENEFSAIEKDFMWHASMIDGTLPDHVRVFPLQRIQEQASPGYGIYAALEEKGFLASQQQLVKTHRCVVADISQIHLMLGGRWSEEESEDNLFLSANKVERLIVFLDRLPADETCVIVFPDIAEYRLVNTAFYTATGKTLDEVMYVVPQPEGITTGKSRSNALFVSMDRTHIIQQLAPVSRFHDEEHSVPTVRWTDLPVMDETLALWRVEYATEVTGSVKKGNTCHFNIAWNAPYDRVMIEQAWRDAGSALPEKLAQALSYNNRDAQQKIDMADPAAWQRLFSAQAESHLIGPLSPEVLPSIIRHTLQYAAEHNDRTVFVVPENKVEEVLKIVKTNKTQAIEVITQTARDQRDEEARRMRPKERKTEKIFLTAAEVLAHPEAFTELMNNAPAYIIPVIVGGADDLKKVDTLKNRINKSFLTMTFDEAGVEAAFFAEIAGDFTIGESLGRQIRFLTPDALLKYHRGRASKLM